jgi:hypothetical protein
LEGKQLIMTKPGSGYSGFVWEFVDADHLRLTNSTYAGSTLSREGTAPLPATAPPAR